MQQAQTHQEIPTAITQEQFDRFVFPHLPQRRRGPHPKLFWLAIINYLLLFLHMGCQWKRLPIAKREDGKPEIHYSRLHRALDFFNARGIIDAIFTGSVKALHDADKLDVRVIHGDGRTTAAKKGGDNLGHNGHKHMKGDKVVAFCDRHGNVLAPFVAAAGNANESPLMRQAIPKLIEMARSIGFPLKETILSLDGVYDGRENRKTIFNNGMIPNIPENRRNRKRAKPGPKRIYDAKIFRERFFTIERVFAWEDKFKRLLLRFERRSDLHYALKMLAYTMINLRHFCQT